MKKLINIFSLACLCMLLSISSTLNAESGDNESRYTENKSNWKQYSEAKRTVVLDDLDIDLSGTMTDTGFGYVEFRIHQKLAYVDCCQYSSDQYSWCDADLQDHKC